MEKINSVLKEVLDEIKPSENDLKKINAHLKKFISQLKEQIKKQQIEVQVFLGGSYAKKTLIKKDIYDIDIFLRFDKKYQREDISKLAFGLLKNFKNVKKVHGSRDYFQIKIDKELIFEIIPVLKINKPEQAKNVTDLSYFHVQFTKKNLTTKKILEEVMLAKAFCYANKVYGAESYIRGFSGYSIELLIYHYKTFKNFLKQSLKIREKIVIDPAKFYKNKELVFMDLNSAKLQSPIILIDPTYNKRNALAALSYEKFEKFKKSAQSFLKKPSKEYFKKKSPDFKKLKTMAINKKLNFILIKSETPKQKGSIAGSKLLKFFNYLSLEIEKFFEIKNKEFEYSYGNSAYYCFIAKPKKNIIHKGPFRDDKPHVRKFKEKHSKIFIKKSRLYTKEKTYSSLQLFFEIFKKKYKKQIKAMYITKLEIADFY